MRCPHCLQDMTQNADGSCSLCGKPCQPASSVRGLYVVTTSLFLSTLIYAGLVLIMEQAPPPASGGLSPIARQLVPLMMLALTPLTFVLSQGVAARIAFRSPIGAAIAECAAAEATCVFGLALYFLLHSVQWFVIFLGLGWLMFLYTSLRIPDYADLLEKGTEKGTEPFLQ